jgi:hypothetical protein
MSAPHSYLGEDFIKELNYKIWSTKSARFNANKRLKLKAKLSDVTISLISAYLIAAGLLSVYGINDENNHINYLITVLSILLLVISQYESSRKHVLNAHIYHTSGLNIAKLYNELRIFKTMNVLASDYEKLKFIKDITSRYQFILDNSPNHDNIDYNRFILERLKTFKTDFPNKIRKHHKILTLTEYYFDVYFWYVLILILPLIAFWVVL